MLEEEGMEIKKCLDIVEFKNFTASNGWLEKWKISYGVRERKVNVEAAKVAEYTVSAWMERLMKLTRGYELADVWNMDEASCFLRHCVRNVLLKRKVKPEEGKCQTRGWPLLSKKLSYHWWCGGAKKRVALKTLWVYPDPMAFITAPIGKHGWLQKLWHQFWAKLIDRWKLLRGKLYFLWITHRAILKV